MRGRPGTDGPDGKDRHSFFAILTTFIGDLKKRHIMGPQNLRQEISDCKDEERKCSVLQVGWNSITAYGPGCPVASSQK